MKKMILTLVILIMAASAAFAQSDAQLSAERIAKLEKLLKKTPDASGLADLDNLVAESIKGAGAAVANSLIITEAANGKVTAENAVALTANAVAEKEALEKIAKLTPEATKSMKSLNPMKMGKAKKALDFSNKVLQLLTEESLYQAQVIASLTKQ